MTGILDELEDITEATSLQGNYRARQGRKIGGGAGFHFWNHRPKTMRERIKRAQVNKHPTRKVKITLPEINLK